MAIWQVELDRRDSERYRKQLLHRGFISASYFSTNGFDVQKMRKMANEGKLDAVRCIIGSSVRWYYAEGDMTAIHYVGSGNKVPTSEGGSPIMDMPQHFPNDVNFSWYIKETAKIPLKHSPE